MCNEVNCHVKQIHHFPVLTLDHYNIIYIPNRINYYQWHIFLFKMLFQYLFKTVYSNKINSTNKILSHVLFLIHNLFNLLTIQHI